MLFKDLFKAIALIGAPLAAYAVNDNCADADKIDTEKCRADILIVTTEERNAKQNEGFSSIVNTLERFAIPANQLSIPKAGIRDDEITRILYSDPVNKKGRYKAVVFPNGRVSYANVQDGDDQNAMWSSALTWSQWDLITQYAANTQSRIVYLNEYPSNNTGTTCAYTQYNLNQKISLEQEANMIDELANVDLNTEQTWHYPAKIGEEQDLRLTYGFEYVRPLMYFEPADSIQERTVAAVECNNQGAEYAGFFTAFGSWSKTAAAINIYWLTWALGDISKISDQHITAEKALGMSAAPKSIKLAFGCIAISTLFVIIATLL